MDSQSLAPTAAPSGQGHADIQALTERIVAASAFVDPLRHGRQGRRRTEGHGRHLLTGLLADGHVLLEGVPGLAKTLAIQTLSRAVNVDFSRIQFTPDLLPADVIGTMIYNQKEEAFSVSKGPIFAHFVLADEINRAPAKVQSALLEAMQERQVTIGSETFPLPKPFLVLATQNLVEQEGTYPSPKHRSTGSSQAVIDYPTPEEEQNILRAQVAAGPKPSVQAVVKAEALLAARELVREVYMDEKVERYIVQLVQATRRPENQGMGHLSPSSVGASPGRPSAWPSPARPAPSWPTAAT